ncbi:MAG: hypothetical protein JXA23_10970 [Bacteroidales bacterium]|nr:hypothetical protein [Bacteroidales bacterium]
MKNLSILIVLSVIYSSSIFAQVGINTDNSAPDPSAGLDVKFTDKGVLIPRMTFEQRNAIVNPAEGLMVICTNCSSSGNPQLSIYLSGMWQNIGSSCVSPSIPTAGTHTPQVTQITWGWNAVPITAGYKWNLVNDYATAVDMGVATTYTETGLTCWTSYTRYLWAYNACGQSSPSTLTQTTLQIPFSQAPTTGTHIPEATQITWNWNTVPLATGYRWNTINDFSTATDMGTSTSKQETGLLCGTSYSRYIWAYDGCGYSPVTTLQESTLSCTYCPLTITDVRDGKVYNTILIGVQCWMAQNLNIGMRINGILDQTDNQIMEKYCYDDLELYCNSYGGLYQWDEAMQYSTTPGIQGICPAGWHLPTDAEWTTLTNFLGGESIAGGLMKETGLAHWALPNLGATNSSGFTALPCGDRLTSGNFNGHTYYTYFWSSTESSTSNAWHRNLCYSNITVSHYLDGKTYGFSVRCLKN